MNRLGRAVIGYLLGYIASVVGAWGMLGRFVAVPYYISIVAGALVGIICAFSDDGEDLLKKILELSKGGEQE